MLTIIKLSRFFSPNGQPSAFDYPTYPTHFGARRRNAQVVRRDGLASDFMTGEYLISRIFVSGDGGLHESHCETAKLLRLATQFDNELKIESIVLTNCS